MYGLVLSNLYANEGTLTGSPVVVTFPWRARKFVVTNDSTINSITVTISGANLTLKPTETLTATVHVNTITINGTGDYRIWAFG
jgi:hypothetical protein